MSAHRQVSAAVLRRVAVDEIIALRQRVLRPGLPVTAAHFDGDLDATTIHLAASSAATVVGCASFMLNRFGDEPAWQLRGMATDPAWRGTGLGRRLLDHGELLLAGHPVDLRWCNARCSAIGFYEKQGWTVVSEEFDIPTAGPHRPMIKRR